jgi:hypothetical protein
MVSTRSQSRLSESGEDVEEDNAHAEVSSNDNHKYNAGKKSRVAAELNRRHRLDAIAEEEMRPTREDDSRLAALPSSTIDKLAAAMFDALGDTQVQARSSGDQEACAGGAGAAAVPKMQRRVNWAPSLTLPPGPSTSARPPNATETVVYKEARVHPANSRAFSRTARASVPDTAGKSWFGLPATAITDEVKRDLRVLRLRSTFDTKTFYKKFDTTKFPKYFHLGTVVEGAADFYGGRMAKRDRKSSLAEEVMADPALALSRKRRFDKLQGERGSAAGGKARQTNNPRLKKKKPRSSH